MPTNKKPFIISLLSHAVFLLIISLTLKLPLPRVTGDFEQPIVSSHLVTAQNIIAAPHPQPIKTALAHALQTSQPASHSSRSATPVSRKGEPATALAALLHAAIEREQRYPGSAQELQQEGRTTLAFTLFPDGRISNLHIAQSSGTEALDQAALAAVNAAAPFQHVDRYLQNAGNYQVDVVFTLTI